RKIVIISDLHDCTFGKNNIRLHEEIDKINPKLIIIAGDIVNNKTKAHNKNAKKFILDLKEKYDIIYCDGNHEQGFFSNKKGGIDEDFFTEFYDIQPHNNLVHLVNDNMTIGNIRFYGLDTLRAYYRRVKRPEFNVDYLKSVIGETDGNYYNILIAHNPVYFEDYAAWGADLVISGHLHGGFVRLPFIGGVISPQLQLFPKYSGGKYKYKESILLLSRGLGAHTLKFRINNLPELIAVSAVKEDN
nr:metallophosphoesterase [Lachnospiraceae bacterium]